VRWLVIVAAAVLALSLLVLGIDLGHPLFNDLPLLSPVPLVAGMATLGYFSRHREKMIAFAAACFFLAAAAWMWSSRDPVGRFPARMVAVGVDGATWDVIDRMELPAFERIRSEGAHGTLRSMEPMFSPLLWTTIASGRKPEAHGIRGFHVQSYDCQVARWWDVAEAQGRAVGLYKPLVDYPPRSFATGGFWVPSWLAPAPDTWPESLRPVKEVELGNRLRRKQVGEGGVGPRTLLGLVQAGVRLSTLLRGARWVVEDSISEPGPARRNVEMQLIRGYIDRDVFVAQVYATGAEVASLNLYATDGLAHLYWDRYEQGGPELRAAYTQADTVLGELLHRANGEMRLLVVSDHGFKAMDGSGEAGQFLPLTERVQSRLGAEGIGKVDVTRVGHKLTVGTAKASEAERARAIVLGWLDREGEPFFRVEPYPGDPGSLALTLAREAVTADRLANDTVGGEPIADYVKLSQAYSGTHDERGIILAWGQGVDAGTVIEGATLLDVAPTLLAGADLPAAEDMSGRSLLWPELPRVSTWDGLVPSLRYLGGEAGSNEEMLEALGYTEGRK